MTDVNTFQAFWGAYPREFCSNKGSKTKAEEAWNKQENKEQIILATRELLKWDRHLKKNGEFVPVWPMPVTFLNQERWRRIEEINYTGKKEEYEKANCSCGKPVAILGKCDKCHYTDQDKENGRYLYAHLTKIGLSKLPEETRQEWNTRCKAWVMERSRKAGGLVKILTGGTK